MKRKDVKKTNPNKKSPTEQSSVQQEIKSVPATHLDDSTKILLRWTAAEYVPQKRWWWFVGLVFIAAMLSLVLFALQLWSVLALVASVTLAMFVTYLPKPRQQSWTLSEEHLIVGKTKIQLNKYRSFTVEELPGTKRIEPKPSITLLPRSWLGWPFPVYLPDSERQQARVVDAFKAVLPVSEAASYRSAQRVIDRAAGWLRL